MLPVILSGGSGTRLWPVSRESFPKQFCELFDESLLRKTIKRLAPFGAPRIITTQGMGTLTHRLYREEGLPPQILLEPQGKNTSAAIAFVCRQLELEGKTQETVGVFPADHFIENTDKFVSAIETATNQARAGEIVTLGISPTYPATGYGYIELAEPEKKGQITALQAKGFREKPEFRTAQEYLDSGRFVWNAGIFVFRCDRMIQLFKEYLPTLWDSFSALKSDHSNLKEVYASAPAISIDYGIMEKLGEKQGSHFKCVPCTDLGWSDVGSWDEVATFATNPKDQITEVESSGNFVSSTHKTRQYAFVGVSDTIVVDTADALLIAKKGQTQAVRSVQAQLAAKQVPAATQHEFEYRPWGYFEILRDTERFKSKVIRVDPGQQLSYQSHAKRAEHWIIIRGSPEVVLNDEVFRPRAGEHIYIPLGAKHRMRNPTQETVEFVEVQVGTYFGEDDIVRYQDDYKRS